MTREGNSVTHEYTGTCRLQEVQVNHKACVHCCKQTGSTFARPQHKTGTCFLSHKWEDDVREEDTCDKECGSHIRRIISA
jgi:hypothetical protein